MEILLEEEAELDGGYTQGLINGVLDGLSDSENPSGHGGKLRKAKKKKKGMNKSRQMEIPDFELADIMGDFEIDALGNFIILRGDKGDLLDKKERKVNRRGYLVDRFGNVINTKGQIIFKALELDSDDEIPAPFGFEKRKKNLLNMNEQAQFQVNNHNPIDDDEDAIDKELKEVKKGRRKKRRARAAEGGGIVEEEEDEESSIDSLLGENPDKYAEGEIDIDDGFIDKVTKKKIPRKK